MGGVRHPQHTQTGDQIRNVRWWTGRGRETRRVMVGKVEGKCLNAWLGVCGITLLLNRVNL